MPSLLETMALLPSNPRRLYMNKRRVIAAIVGSALVALTASTFTSAAVVRGDAAAARVTNAAGTRLGIVRFASKDGKVLVRARFSGLTPGFHGFHVHAVGICEPPFTSAGGHLNSAAGTNHGAHAGDMPPLLVASDGTASVRFTTDRFTLDQLFDSDGSSVIVHADPDNLAHIPARYHSHAEEVFGPDSQTRATGDAGGRTGCGVIQRLHDRHAEPKRPLGN